MKALIVLILFVSICALSGLFFAPVVSQFKENADVRAYQHQSLLDGIDVLPEGQHKYQGTE
jgi:hypothetical protein